MSDLLQHPPIRSVPPKLTRSLAVLGDAGNISTWSGTAYNFFANAHADGFLTHALNLEDPQYGKHRNRWRMTALARLQKPLGYQYSDACGQRLWDIIPEALKSGEIISHHQSFPSVAAIKTHPNQISYYLDATLKTNAIDLGDKARLAPKLLAEFYERERELYRHARFVVAMSRSTARSIVEDYQIDSDKVFVVRPGANIDDAAVNRFRSQRGVERWRIGEPFTKATPAILGFIGLDPIRKNLPLLVRVAEILDRRGRPVKVRVVGACTKELSKHPLVDFVGRIDKRSEMDRFVAMLGSFAIGCLLSTGEPLGISTLECLRLGVPVLGRDTGGIPDCIPAVAGILTKRDATAEQIADQLEARLFDPFAYAAMCVAAEAESEAASWHAAVAGLQAVWNGQARAFAG